MWIAEINAPFLLKEYCCCMRVLMKNDKRLHFYATTRHLLWFLRTPIRSPLIRWPFNNRKQILIIWATTMAYGNRWWLLLQEKSIDRLRKGSILLMILQADYCQSRSPIDKSAVIWNVKLIRMQMNSSTPISKHNIIVIQGVSFEC